MKSVFLGSLILITYLTSYAQEVDPSCMSGDCQNSFGSYYDEAVGVVYHGFYLDGSPHGVGYGQSPNGNYYLSKYEHGTPDGFTVYNEGGGRTSGVYVDGRKSGNHVRNADTDTEIVREVMSYYHGALATRKTYTASKNADSACIAGDCDNGFGMLNNSGFLIIAEWKDQQIVHGEMLNIQTGVREFFMPPVEVEYVTPYFKVTVAPEEVGFKEIAAMYIGPKLAGEYLFVNISTAAVGAGIFKDDELVKRF
jgi:hypothetical protein